MTHFSAPLAKHLLVSSTSAHGCRNEGNMTVMRADEEGVAVLFAKNACSEVNKRVGKEADIVGGRFVRLITGHNQFGIVSTGRGV